MKKLMVIVAAFVCAVSFVGVAIAAETQQNDSKETEQKTAEAKDAEALEEEESEIFEIGFDLEFFSAYVWRNAVLNDKPVIQPCVWGELTYFEPFWFGFWIWQNYDLTDRRRSDLRNALSETDYNVHAGVTLWSSDDETMSLGLEIGHEWYANMSVQRGLSEDYHDVRELYAKLTFDNEFVNVYGQASWMYDDFGCYKQGFYYELGFNKEIDVLSPFELPEDTLILGLDWNLSFGDSRYLYYLYGGVDYVDADADGEDDSWSNPSSGIGGTTVKAYLNWKVTENVSLVGTIAYTGLLNGSSRDELDYSGSGWEDDKYPRDLLWWGFSLKFAF